MPSSRSNRVPAAPVVLSWIVRAVGFVAPDIKMVCGCVKVCTIDRPATVVLVAGNVIVVASVPASVSELLTVSNLPVAMLIPRCWTFQLAAVVGVATNAVKIAEPPAAIMMIVFAPELSIVRAAVELLINM